MLHRTPRTVALARTELAIAQPGTVIVKLFKLAARVVPYNDRIRLCLPTAARWPLY